MSKRIGKNQLDPRLARLFRAWADAIDSAPRSKARKDASARCDRAFLRLSKRRQEAVIAFHKSIGSVKAKP